MRADQLLMHRGLAPSRSAAQRLIERGAVRWRSVSPPSAGSSTDWRAPRKAGDDLPDHCELQITDDAELRWVSRAGLKLDAALAHTGLDLQGRSALDIGQSTGGFTQVLLAHGVTHVVGVDVGHGQLHATVRGDTRVTALEGINARHLTAAELQNKARTTPEAPSHFGIVVADLSFISLTLVLPALTPFISGDAVLLVKPQFELQPADLGKGGLVSDPASYAVVEQRLRDACAEQGLPVKDYFEADITGGDGNREFFVWVQAKPAAAPTQATRKPTRSAR
jgi:23S rRNA (cytidine1920-2'-O)/16S rRNA (cytidine1409-2'-O)-methyltransferase